MSEELKSCPFCGSEARWAVLFAGATARETLAAWNHRALEREANVVGLLTNLAQILDIVKQEWAESWSAWDQEQRDAITRFLTYYYRSREGDLRSEPAGKETK